MLHLATLASYVPGLAAEHIARTGTALPSPSVEEDEAAVLFLDVSGFTALTERLGQRGAVGAEQMGRLLSRDFGLFVDTVSAHGGQVVDFAGDALFALWRGEALGMCTLRAATCALALQDAVAHSTHGSPLSIKISVGAGPVRILHVGEGSRHCLAAGPAFSQVTSAEDHTEPDEVVLSAEAAPLLDATTEPRPEGRALLLSLRAPAPEAPRSPLHFAAGAESLLAPYVPRSVVGRVLAGQGAWMSEFRRITTVFVNVVGLNYQAPDAHEQLHEVAEAVRRVVDRFEGRIQQFVIDDKGTVLLIAFGLPPHAHEDDPRRGVQGALRIEEALSELGLRSAIGITTSRVYCGPIGGAARRHHTVVGDRINLAARLMQAALDDVLCDAPTCRHLDEAMYEALPPLKVKGKAASVPVFRPFGVGDTAHRRTSQTPLVGRESERAQLDAHVTALSDGGAGGLVLLEGEAGIGKSRLLEQLVEDAEVAGLVTRYGAARAMERSAPYSAWGPILREILGLSSLPDNPGARRRHMLRRLRAEPDWFELAPLLDDVLHLGLRDNGVTGSMAGRRRATRTRDLLAHLLGSDTSVPTLWVLEDAQWLDSASWALLHELAERRPQLLMVVTSRPMSGPSADDLRRLRAAAGAHILLQAMPSAEALDLVRARLGVSTLPKAVERLIIARAEGHPFYSEELALALRDRGVLTVYDGRARLAPGAKLGELDLPDTVQGVITSRIDRLDDEQQLVLKVGSVIGRVVDVDTLHAVYPIERTREQLTAALEQLVELDLVRPESPEPELAYLFKHIFTRDVTYDAMAYSQRRQLHGRVAERIEGQAGAGARASTLAHHWSQAAGEGSDSGHALRRAVHYLELSGAEALRTGAFTEAARLLQRAFDSQRRLPEADQHLHDELRLLKLLGTATFTTAGYGSQQTVELYERGVRLADGQVSDAELFPFLFGLWIARHFTKAVDQALEVGERMLAIAEASGDVELRLQAHHAMWTSLLEIPDYPRARWHLEQGAPLYQGSMHESHCVLYGGHDPGACAHRAMGLSDWTLGHPDRAMAHIEQAVAMGQRHDYSVATAQLAHAWLHRQRGEVDEAEAVARDLIARASAHNLVGFAPWAEIFLAWARGHRGELEEGIAEIEALLPSLGIVHPPYLSMLVELYLLAGRCDDGLRLLDKLFEAMVQRDEHVYEAELLRLRGELRALNGDADAGHADVLAALDTARQQGAVAFELRAATTLARLTPEPDQARAVLEPVLATFNEGLQTADLRAARAVLVEIARAENTQP